jgi:hypothetical protein
MAPQTGCAFLSATSARRASMVAFEDDGFVTEVIHAKWARVPGTPATPGTFFMPPGQGVADRPGSV